LWPASVGAKVTCIEVHVPSLRVATNFSVFRPLLQEISMSKPSYVANCGLPILNVTLSRPNRVERSRSTQADAQRSSWICEQHPDQGWPHDDCAGPGMPCPRCNTDEPPRLPEGFRSFVK
jgi:hypothetical protein